MSSADNLIEFRRRIVRNIREFRRVKNLTIFAAARRAHMHWRHWQKLEGNKMNVTLKTLARIARALEVDPRDLLVDESPPEKKDP